MAIETFTRKHCSLLRDEINAALAEVASRHGIKIDAGNASYSDNTINFKLKLQLDGFDPLKDEFEKYASLFGLKKDDFGREFMIGLSTYKIVGIKSRNRKYPIICEKNGSTYKLPENQVVAALNGAS